MRGHKLGVPRNGHMDRLQEQLDGGLGHGHKAGRLLHTLRVHVGAENVDGLVVGAADGFEAFVALLAVVQAGGHAMNAEVGVFHKLRGRPLAGFGGVVGFDMAGD